MVIYNARIYWLFWKMHTTPYIADDILVYTFGLIYMGETFILEPCKI